MIALSWHASVLNQKFSCSRKLVAMGDITSWLTVKFYEQKASSFTPSFLCNEARFLNFRSVMPNIRDWIPQRINKAGKFSLTQFKEHANWKQLSHYEAYAVGGLFLSLAMKLPRESWIPRHRLCVGQDQAGGEKIVCLETILDRSFHPPSSLAFFPENFFCI